MKSSRLFVHSSILFFVVFVLVGCGKTAEMNATATAEAKEKIVAEKQSIFPPGEGVFFVTDDLQAVQIPLNHFPHDISTETYIQEYPTVDSRLPFIIWSFPTTNLRANDVELRFARPTLGFSYSDSSQSPCIAEDVTQYSHLMQYDRILSIDNQEMINCAHVSETMIQYKPGDTLKVIVQRSTGQEEVTIALNHVNINGQTINIQTFNLGYGAFIPEKELNPGIYCVRFPAGSRGFCFKIE